MPDKCPKCGAAYRHTFINTPVFECGSCGTARKPSMDCLTRQLAQRDERIRKLEQRLAEIDAGAQADADDLAKMRDGTKLTRAGCVQIIVYQQQDIAELKAKLKALKAALGEIHRLINEPMTPGVRDCIDGIASAALSPSGEAGAEAGA